MNNKRIIIGAVSYTHLPQRNDHVQPRHRAQNQEADDGQRRCRAFLLVEMCIRDSNTVVWVVSVVGLSTLFGFIIAMTLNQKFHGRKLARSVVVFPWATSLVIQASVWNYIIKYEYGNLNNVLLNLGIIRDAINWRATYRCV